MAFKNTYNPKPIVTFVGRRHELQRLKEIHGRKSSSVIVVHGRRRVGKTSLIEHFFGKSHLIKFEGLQVGPSESEVLTADNHRQLTESVRRLGVYLKQEQTFKKLALDSWTDFFELLTPHLETGEVILYFEEVQWLACYQDDFFIRMKPFWDDHWQHNSRLRIVISGSSPSFVISQFLSDKAMYNRATEVLNVRPFRPSESAEFLCKHGRREQLLAMICVGGVPEYLKQLRDQSSILIGLSRKSFLPSSFFTEEYTRIFVSSMARNAHYRETIRILSHHGSMSKDEIARKLKIKGAGGTLSQVLADLDLCGFIQCLVPVHMPNSERLRRFMIADEYLAFYHNFIEPKLIQIREGLYSDQPERGINRQSLQVFLGFALERWCRKNHRLIASYLGFSGVDYNSGQYFHRGEKGVQIDLMFLRADNLALLIEVKYTLGSTVPKASAAKLRDKWTSFIEKNPRYKDHSIQCALLTNALLPMSSPLKEDFDIVINVEDLLTAN